VEIKEALGRLPREVIDARIQRLKRAMDLSMKHQYLPEHVQVRAPSFPLDLDLSIRIMVVVVVTVASEAALGRF
jgi:ubiquinol-cytochrome c reductase subunit 7